MKLFLFFLLATLITLLQTTTALSSGSYSMNDVDDVTVDFNNRLPQNENFTVHCNSHDDDLGAHIIAPSNFYEFSFEVDFFQTTYFFCSLRWRQVEAAFYAYRASRDLNRCRHYCLWNVKEHGVEGYPQGDGTQPDIIVSWK